MNGPDPSRGSGHVDGSPPRNAPLDGPRRDRWAGGMTRTHGLSLAEARRVLDAGLAEATRIGVPITVAVVDDGGHLVAFARQDGAIRVSVPIAERKARTAVLVETPTAALTEAVQPGGPLYGLESAADGLVVLGGGVPLVRDGVLVGGVGASAGSVEQDVAVATAAAAAVAGA